MRFRLIHLAALRDFCFVGICAGILVLTATSILWVYATYFAPKEKPRRIAEEGTFFLRTYASVRTAHGIFGLPAGERVRRVNSQTLPGMIRVTDGEHQFDVFAYQLTDDIDTAEALCGSDGEAQRQLAERAASDTWAAQNEQNQYNLAHASDVARVSAQWRSASVVGALLTPLNTGVVRKIGGSPYPVFWSAPTSTRQTGSASALPITSRPPVPTPTAPAEPATLRYIEDPLSRVHRATSTGGVSSTPGW